MQCPLLAESGHFASEFPCPLLGAKRTLGNRPNQLMRVLNVAVFAANVGYRARAARKASQA